MINRLASERKAFIMQRMSRLIWLSLLLCGLASGAFVVPTDGPLPFRRDKLPIDVETMVSLSGQFVTIARDFNGTDPESERAVAQMLAISIALDPSNGEAEQIVKTLAEGGSVDAPASRDLKIARTRAWNLLDWLRQPEAGADGRVLAACMGDVLARVDPEHPFAADMRGKKEQGKWGGWVAPLAAFRDEKPTGPTADQTRDPEPEPGSNPPDTGSAEIKLTESSTRMPLYYYDPSKKETVLGILEVKLEVVINDEKRDRSPRIRIGETEKEDWNLGFNEGMVPLLENRHGKLPGGLRFDILLPENIKLSPRNGEAVNTAIAILTDSAFVGVPPAGCVLAVIGEEGELELPPCFWQTLRGLGSKPGNRLVLPSAAREFLPALLTLDKAEFFFRHEVLLARDLNELLDLASGKPPQRLVAAHEAFETIRSARGTRSLGSFVGFPSTKERLSKVIKLMPEHASTAGLLLRASTRWPLRLSRPVYAREIRMALEPVGALFSRKWDSITPAEIQKVEGQCRAGLAVVDKIHGVVADRTELHAPAALLVKRLAGLASDIKRLPEDDEWKAQRMIKSIYNEYIESVETLTDAAGDEDSYPVPAPRGD